MTEPAAPGHIDGFNGTTLYGWLLPREGVEFVIRIDRHQLFPVKPSVSRTDVAQAVDSDNDMLGFEISLSSDILDGSNKQVELLAIDLQKVETVVSRTLPFPDSQVERTSHNVRRAAVVSWDLAHNPAGRAIVLHDILSKEYDQVDLIGPCHPRFGMELWAPLQGMPDLNVVTAPVKTFAELTAFATKAAKVRYDFVWICKPRFAGLFIGLQIHEASSCRVALDIDDYEMAFFRDRMTAELQPDTLGALRAGRIEHPDLDATILAHSCIDRFNIRTVSNIALQRMFGGQIVPHTRSDEIFKPSLYKKTSIRKELGLPAKAHVVVFIGTIRRHKGILEVARAVGQIVERNDATPLNERARSSVHLLVAGSYESEEVKQEIVALTGGRCTLLGEVPFHDLPKLLAAGDQICLPQDMDAETSYFQLPSKIADGLSMGLKVLVNDLPPYDDLRDESGIFVRAKDEPLGKAITRVAKRRVSVDEIRGSFERRFSSDTLAIRLAGLFKRYEPFDTIDEPEECFRTLLDRSPRATKVLFNSVATRSRSRDLVILWKQHDSGLFGRRVDMIAKYALEGGMVDRVLLIDKPVSAWEVNQLERRAREQPLSSASLVYNAMVPRFLGQADRGNLLRKSYITSESGETMFGRRLPSMANLDVEIAETLQTHGIGQNAILWNCPVVPHVDAVLKAHPFKRQIVDLIDDQREFGSSDIARMQSQRNYVHTLGMADHVFTNNAVMAERFRNFTKQPITVVPNGVERVDPARLEILRMAGLPDGVSTIGYLGNLRDRVDIGLLLRIADASLNWHVLLVGPTGGNPDVEKLTRHPRITLTGPMTYERSRSVAAGFDVGIIPHKIDALTESMNPLKFFLYKELGLPIVTTPVQNLGSSKTGVYIAKQGDDDDFVRCIEMALSTSIKNRRSWTNVLKKRQSDLWEDRLADIQPALIFN